MDEETIAIVVVCACIGASVIALIVFVLVFCRVKLKDDSNVRKRIITKNAFEEKREEFRPPTPIPEPMLLPPPPIMLPPEPVILPPPPMIMPPPPPILLPPPPPVVLPPPPPPPQPALPRQIVIQRPAPVPASPAPEPRVIVREIIRERSSSPPARRRKHVHRRRSWGGGEEQGPGSNDWVLVKRVKKRNGRVISNRGYTSNSESSCSSDDEDTIVKRPQPMMMPVPMGLGMQRLAPYDLATPVPVAAPRGMMMAPMGAAAVQQPGYISVMMPPM